MTSKLFFRMKPYYLCATLPWAHQHNPLDRLEKHPLDGQTPITGMDRLYFMFQQDKHGKPSKEIVSIIQITGSTFIVGGALGGLKNSVHAYNDFIARHETTSYISPYHAKRDLSDYITIKFFQAAWKFGVKCALFCGSFIAVSTLISVYRGKSGVREYSIAGLVAGAIYRFHRGLKAMANAAFFGFFFGTVAGCVIYVYLFMCGLSMEEFRQWQYDMKRKRDESANKMLVNSKLFVDNMSESLRYRVAARKENSGFRIPDTGAVYVLTDESESPNETESANQPSN